MVDTNKKETLTTEEMIRLTFLNVSAMSKDFNSIKEDYKKQGIKVEELNKKVKDLERKVDNSACKIIVYKVPDTEEINKDLKS